VASRYLGFLQAHISRQQVVVELIFSAGRHL
jgi:hypothetical protein